MDFSTARDYALSLDASDPLAGYRQKFVISDPDLIYLDGNSLGRLPKATAERIREIVTDEWGNSLVRGWGANWWESPSRLGDKLGGIIGAAPGQVLVCDSVSTNLFKLATAAFRLRPRRTKLITDTLNFPSDLYILQGIVQFTQHIIPKRSGVDATLPGNPRGSPKGYEIIRIPSRDGDLTPDLAALAAAIDEDTALVTFSHVVFKSGYRYDMAEITRLAHAKGALVLWDLSHSVGVVPVELDACGADFAIGCTYKYLNGGPGSSGFLYVNKALQGEALSPIWGWWGQDKPFDFWLDYTPAPGVKRFLSGSQPILSMLAIEPGLDLTIEAGMERIRDKSIRLTEYAIQLTDEILAPLGFTPGSPRDPHLRGGHVSLRHADGYRINRTLIEEMKVIPDFRAPDNIRLGFAPLYTSFAEVWEGIERIRRVVADGRHEKYSHQRQTVT